MEVTLKIPDDVAHLVATNGKDVSRVALEAFALEGYRSEALTENEVRQMLGFDTNLQVHAFLKEHGVHLQYSLADLEEDDAAARKLVEQIRVERASDKLPER